MLFEKNDTVLFLGDSISDYRCVRGKMILPHGVKKCLTFAPECRDRDLLTLLRYIAPEDKAEKVFENQSVLKQPIVRNGKQATVGYRPDVWKAWQI